MGCTNSKVQVAPQKVTKGLASGDEDIKRRDTRPKSRGSIRSLNETKTTSSSSTMNAKSTRNVQQAMNCSEASNSSKPYGPNVVMVREAKQKAEEHAISSSLASTRGCKTSVLISSRNSSASSNSTSMSSDSGLGEEYAHIITEKSDTKSQEIAKVPNNFDVPNLEITGVQLAVPEPMGHRMRSHARQQANQQFKAQVKQPLPPWTLQKKVGSIDVGTSDPPDVIQCPSSGRGISFEVQVGTRGLEGGGKRKKKPVAVRRLETRQKDVASKKELEEKQIAAEQRRKVLEQKLLERLKAQQEKEREIKESLSKFITMTTEKTGKKMEVTLESHEAHLKELHDHLKEKHVEEVRRDAKPCPIKQPTFSHEDNPPVSGTN